MMSKKDELLRDPDVRRSYEQELLFGEVTETLDALLQDVNVSRSELARRLRVTKGRISQMLSGRRNLTLRSLADLAWALGYRFTATIEPIEDRAGTPASHDAPAPKWVERQRARGSHPQYLDLNEILTQFVIPATSAVVWPTERRPREGWHRVEERISDSEVAA